MFKALDEVEEEGNAYLSDGSAGGDDNDAEADSPFKPTHHRQGGNHRGRRCLQVCPYIIKGTLTLLLNPWS